MSRHGVGQSLLAPLGDEHLIAGEGEGAAQGVAHRPVVVYNENAHASILAQRPPRSLATAAFLHRSYAQTTARRYPTPSRESPSRRSGAPYSRARSTRIAMSSRATTSSGTAAASTRSTSASASALPAKAIASASSSGVQERSGAWASVTPSV